MKTTVLAGAAVVALGLAACSSTPDQPRKTPSPSAASSAAMATTSTVQRAHVNLAGASGSIVSGRLTITPMGDGVHFSGEIGGFKPNSTHAIHIHEKGDCSAADASSAGGHFNPAGVMHGRVGSTPHHAGDMDNIVADAKGVATVDVHASGPVLGGGAPNDAIGRAVVVHAAADDYTSQPAGDAGARVACGVIQAG
ncbi:superoxide dismutase family protein [Novilysobacter antarcticus]|uniref:superoxide dismutase family protein n=1 Tax=Novilysobacter antarcticus TaxID=2862543 RepID=UPI001C998C4F|nr:superoxide dismutase family protein [Lysobacter antarcticus]